MKRTITNGAVAVLVVAVVYALILAAIYGMDKQYCAGFGYKNKITPTLEGYCTREVAGGATEVVAVEYMTLLKRNSNAGEKGWRNEK